MTYVIFLPTMSFAIADMAFQFTYSDYSYSTTKTPGDFCEEGEELSRVSLKLPSKPRSDSWLANLVPAKIEEKTFTFKCPFKGSIASNSKVFGIQSWWHEGGKRPAPGPSRREAFDAGFQTTLIVDRYVEYRGIRMYSDMLFWMRENSDHLEAIAKESSGYFDTWRNILELEIEYLTETLCPVIPYDVYKQQTL
ncbi:MAG: hypothetical protein AAGM38_11745 [Pseudomonadota bacterium]